MNKGTKKKRSHVHADNAVSKSTNPIVKTVETYMLARGIEASFRPLATPNPAAETKKIILTTFDDAELRQQLGDLVLEALMDGNREFANTVKKAIKEMDHVFNRDREKVIGDDVFAYVYSLPKPRPTGHKLREAVEKRFNKSIPFADYRWRSLSRILLEPRRSVGRPKKIKHESA